MGVGINKNCGVGKSEKFSAHVLAVALYNCLRRNASASLFCGPESIGTSARSHHPNPLVFNPK